MTRRSPPLRIQAGGEARLASQARALARPAGPGEGEGEGEKGGGSPELQVITFRLGGQACALEARVVDRAVTRLGATVAVPLGAGGRRLVAWIEERPVAVTDLWTLAGREARPAQALALAPAVLVPSAAGAVALAVEGPLLLAEERLALQAGLALRSAPGLRLEGRLAGGAALLDARWLVAAAAGWLGAASAGDAPP